MCKYCREISCRSMLRVGRPLNAQKTEFILCAPARRRHHIPIGDVQVGHGSVHPVQSARDLGVYVDGGMTMRTQINHVLSSCYCALRQIRSIMPCLPSHALNTLVTALVHSRLDYCMLSSLVFQPVTSSGCSQSSTQPYVWSPAHRDAIT